MTQPSTPLTKRLRRAALGTLRAPLSFALAALAVLPTATAAPTPLNMLFGKHSKPKKHAIRVEPETTIVRPAPLFTASTRASLETPARRASRYREHTNNE